MPEHLTRTELFRVSLIVVTGIVLVAAAALIIDQRPRGDAPASFGRLEAPVDERDLAAAEAARSVRDAIEEARRNGVTVDGGLLGTGFGWLDAVGNDGYERSLLSTLAENGVLDAAAVEQANGLGILVHRCGERFGVLVRSAVASEDGDLTWWREQACDLATNRFFDGPTFIALGEVRTDS